ncbi:enoyl-CoA hydratase/isomerase family protein [Candidatus Sumerlaeota bacterium]|nr:enoyl-CoA hydratase/isomerase family protein [Candidatus Sumerlaeota bacterium]
MSDLVKLTQEGDIAVITVNNPPVNALSPGVPEGIYESIEKIEKDPSVKAAILIGEGQTFIAGADIKQFGKITSGEMKRDPAGLHTVLNKMELSSKPIICAIHGTAFGGGLEFAMACHYRIAVSSAQVGQPEVKLGIIPGAGGTQRLPRLCGVMKAVEMCAQGDPVKAPEALKLGILDRVIEGDLKAGAIAYAKEIIAEGKPPRRTRDLSDKLGDAKQAAMICAMARTMAQQKARGMIAPIKAIDAVEAAASLPFEDGLKREAELFIECLVSPQSKAMIHVFFSQRATSKIPGLPKDVKPLPIKKAAIIGAGTMGGGIAMCYANAGIPVIVKEVKQEFLDRGMETIKKNYDGSVKKGKLTPEKMADRLKLIMPTLTYDEFKDVDIVVEAAFEDLEIKKSVFRELDKVTKPSCILATNTSTLDIDKMAEVTSKPQQVIGHHFFSPANVMQLLEIVRGAKTSNEVIVTSLEVAKKLKKVGVLVGNCFGFVGNRMVGQYTREAQFLLEEGATPAQVDKALTDFGMAMGPCAMSDLAGVDVGWRVKQGAKAHIPAGQRQSAITDKLYELGRYGQKTGKGFYLYNAGDRKPVPDPEVDKIIEQCAKDAGITRRTITGEEIIERTIYALINEGAKILEEGFASKASDIDIIYIFGYGFPPFRGGPMWYGSTVGLKKVYEKVCEFEKMHGDLWKPSGLLKKLADEGKTFEAFDKSKGE